jgi:16S rRNA processing protein RimM
MAEKEIPEVMGRFGAVYGIKGWLKVFSETEDPESLFTYSPWFFKHKGGQWREVKLENYRRHSDAFIVKIEGIDVREEAQAFTGAEIGILGSSLPPLPENVYRWRDLIGLKVVNKQDYCLGHVKSLMDLGSNDVLVVKPEINDVYEMNERLIPYVTEQYILKVDLENKVILVDWEPDF